MIESIVIVILYYFPQFFLFPHQLLLTMQASLSPSGPSSLQSVCSQPLTHLCGSQQLLNLSNVIDSTGQLTPLALQLTNTSRKTRTHPYVWGQLIQCIRSLGCPNFSRISVYVDLIGLWRLCHNLSFSILQHNHPEGGTVYTVMAQLIHTVFPDSTLFCVTWSSNEQFNIHYIRYCTQQLSACIKFQSEEFGTISLSRYADYRPVLETQAAWQILYSCGVKSTHSNYKDSDPLHDLRVQPTYWTARTISTKHWLERFIGITGR